MTEPEDTIVLGKTRYWIKRPYRPQPTSDSMLPEIENPPAPASGHTVFGYHFIDPRRPAKPVVRTTYDIFARTGGSA